MTFPQYRKLKDRSFYKIVSENELFELQKLGKKYVQHHLIAHTFLDRNLISDLLESDSRYEVISEIEYENIVL